MKRHSLVFNTCETAANTDYHEIILQYARGRVYTCDAADTMITDRSSYHQIVVFHRLSSASDSPGAHCSFCCFVYIIHFFNIYDFFVNNKHNQLKPSKVC